MQNHKQSNVFYCLDPPGQPIISGYTTGVHIAAGSVQRISCISSGGHPPATLTWYKNDKKVSKSYKIEKLRLIWSLKRLNIIFN